MNRYPIIVIIFVVGFFKLSYGQSGVKPAGIYEVGDTTIEVYHWKDPYAIREFKIINGTETILYRSFNRLTKKLQEEGTFRGGYSSGMWKFYGWTGRLKKEIKYDNMVKTCYEKKVELHPEEVFDFAKFKEDSIFVEKYRKQKMQATNKNVIHDTVYIERPGGLPKGVPANKASQTAAVKTAEPVKAASVPVQPGAEEKETPIAVATKPTEAKTTEPAKAPPSPAPPAPVKKETPAAVATKPTEVKTTEPAKAPPSPIPPAPVKKETPAAVATKPTEIKTTEPAKAPPSPIPPAPVKKETPTAATTSPTAAKATDPANVDPIPAQPAVVKKETPIAVTKQPTEVKKAEPVSTPTKAEPVKKEPSVATQATETKKNDAAKPTLVPKKSEPIKKETPEENKTKVAADKKEEEATPTPVKQKKDAAFIEQQVDEETEVNEEQTLAVVKTERTEPETKPSPVEQNENEVLIEQQQEIKQTEVKEENVTVPAAEVKNEKVSVPDSLQQEPVEAVIKKVEEKRKPLNQNQYYGCRANGNWFEISSFRPNEFVKRYDTRTEDKARFSFFEFAMDSIGKLKKEKIITQVSDLKKQPLLKLQLIDSLALVYGMQAMDKPFSHLLEYTVDSTQESNARFELYITGMPYNKSVEENKITEPFDFIVLDPWTGQLITKGNGSAVTDNDNELSIRMTTLIRNQDVQ
jgi:hypothetical protein